MPDARTIELIQRGLDDAVLPAEQVELEQRLASDPEARTVRDEFRALNSMLAETPVAEPPAGLVGEVMAQVRIARANAPALFVDRRADRDRKRTLAMRFALGVAAALAIGFVLIPSLRQTIDPSHVRGTMIGNPEGAEAVSEIPIRGTSFSGKIRVTADADRVALAIELDSLAERQVRVSFDPAVLYSEAQASGIDASTDSGGEATRSFEVSGAATRLEFARKSPQASKIDLSIRQGGEVFEATINLGRSTNF